MSGTARWRVLAFVILALAAAAVLPAGSPARAQTGNLIGETPTHWVFGPIPVTNRQAVRLSYVNNSAQAITMSMEIYGSKISGTTWNPANLLAAMKPTELAPGQTATLVLNWSLAGGLADGERAQVLGRLHTTEIITQGECPVASLASSDLLGLLPPQLADPRPDPVLGQTNLTQDSAFEVAVISNRNTVTLSYANTFTAPVMVSMELFGGKITGQVINTALLASRQNLTVGPGQGVLLSLNVAALNLGATDRAQVYGRLHVTGIVTGGECPVASLQVGDLLGVVPAHIIEAVEYEVH